MKSGGGIRQAAKGKQLKIVRSNKIINLDKFESVQYRESLMGADHGYPVEAIRHEVSGGFFGGSSTVEEEIARPTSKQCAQQLVADISKAWLNDQNAFDVDEWFAARTEKE